MARHWFGRVRHLQSSQLDNQARLRCEFLEDRVTPATIGPPLAANGQILAVDPSQYEASDILVCFKPGADPSALAGTRIGDQFELIPGLYQVHLSSGVSATDALAAYQASPLVAYAQLDYRVRLEVMPNDPQFSSQWGLNNTGQNGGTPGVDIQAPAAWDLTTGSGNTIVAVIDSGVDYNHPDLAANIWTNPGEIAGNGVDDDHNGFVDDIHGYDFANRDGDPMDDFEHGTHVAGIIGAVGDNGVGIAGVNWHVKIMALKVLDSSGSGTTSDVIKALNYAVANGAAISNNSYGGDPYSQALYDAINNARAAGHIYVAAAGNGNFLGIGQDNDENPFYPASYNLPNVVAVAATDSSDNLAFFSNYGATSVDLAAPGVGILSTTPNNTYSTFDGTSMATPFVTGALALVRDLHPGWTYGQVISQILNTVDVIPSLQGKTVTGGRLNLARAVLPPPVVDLNWTGGSLSGPATADWQSTFTINRTYNITGEDAQHDFSIAYYASLDSTFGNGDDVFLGSESITSAAGKTMGIHGGTSPAVQIVTGGTFHLFAKVDSGSGIYETDETNNVVVSAQTVLVTGPIIVDNSQSAYSETGTGWTNWTANGYGGSLHYHAAGTGANTAIWQAPGIASGYYRIQATWNGDRTHATNATFSIYDGTTLVQTALVDQQAAPSGDTIGGVIFQNLATINLTSGNLKVVLSDNANANVVADAIRLVPIPPPIIDLNWSGGGITGPTSTDTQTPFTINRTYTITGEAASSNFNISYFASSDATFGNGDDMLLGTEAFSADADKAIGNHAGISPNLQITTGGTFYLFAKVDGGNAILETDDTNNVAQAPQSVVVATPIILDNGQAAYSESGSGWLGWSSGYAGALRYHPAGTGANSAAWQVSGLAAGYYQVQATWNADANHATNAPFSIYDGTTLVQTAAVNQRPAPSGALVGGVRFQNFATVQITSGTVRIVLSDAANGYVVADAVRLVPMAPPSTDLNWVNGGISGPATTDVQSSFSINRTYIINGTPAGSDFTIAYYASADATFGNADDQLLGSETISASADKSVGSHAGASPNLQITTGGTYYLFAKLDSASSVLETDETNNAVQSPQTLAVAGPMIMDNSQAGYSETGSGWVGWSSGYAGNLRYHAAGTGANKATWQATGLVPGYYQVQATWNADANHASNAPFSIYDGTTLVQTVAVNQKTAPSGTAVGGVQFQTFATVHVTGNSMKVVLTDGANGYVVADAIRLAPLPPPTSDLNWNDGGISGPSTADSQSTFTINRTYTISGTAAASDFGISYYASTDATLGNADDILLGSETISAAADKAAGSHSGTSPNLQITAGGVYYLLAKIDSTSAILETDETNNAAQAPQTILVSGPVIVDNSQPAYGESGAGWLGWSAGYLGNLRYHAKGTGANTASWQATGLPAGYYKIQATWNADPNHATNAPFSIYDGSTLLQTVLVNQRPSPAGDTVGNIQFQTLATVQITSGTLQVVLSDAANGYVVADAIRLIPTTGPQFLIGSPADSSTSIGSPPAAPVDLGQAPTIPIGHRTPGSIANPVPLGRAFLRLLASFLPGDPGLPIIVNSWTGPIEHEDSLLKLHDSYLMNELLMLENLKKG